MIDPTTPAARALLRWATDEAAYWDGVATDPEPLNSLLRKGAESRRDQLDAVVARLRTARSILFTTATWPRVPITVVR